MFFDLDQKISKDFPDQFVCYTYSTLFSFQATFTAQLKHGAADDGPEFVEFSLFKLLLCLMILANFFQKVNRKVKIY